MNCPTCKSLNVKSDLLPSREEFSIQINKCKDCGHFFQLPEKYEEVYSTGEFSLSARQSLEPTSDKIKSLDKRAFERIHFYSSILSKYQDVLEIGSSIGSFLHLLKMHGKSVDGLEPDPIYAAFSERQYFLKQKTGLFEDFNFQKKYDFVCSFHVIEHIQYLDRFIEKSWELLEEGGGLLFECPSLDIHAYGDMKFTIWKPHMHYFTLASMYSLLAGKFEVIELGYYGMSIYVYALKSNTNTYKQGKFKKYKTIGKNTERLIKATPALSIGKVEKTKLRQFLVQPFIQKNTREKLNRYINLSTFALKAINYNRKEQKGRTPNATHVSYYSAWENAGDTVLSQCVRKVFNSKFDNGWDLKAVNKPVTEKTISEINNSKYLLIGGGGLLLPDTNKNNISGWQWAISKEKLLEINVPKIVYAVGYNFFKGQKPDQLFIDNLNLLIEKVDFFSLRNQGSIQRVRELVPPSLHEKILYQPCPTTIINKFYKLKANDKINKSVGVNLAFDRYEKRFGKDMYLILDQLGIGLKKIQDLGYKIFYINHLKGDDKFEIVLDKFKVDYKSINLQYSLPKETISFYNKMEIVLGARGHAQMIPFGVGTRILSLGTHDKLKYFLDDIEATDWFIDLLEDPKNLSEYLLNKFVKHNEKEVEEANSLIFNKSKELYQITKSNLTVINELFE